MLEDKIPKVPHWLHIYMTGEDHPEYDEAFYILDRYIKTKNIQVGTDFGGDNYQYALKIYNIPPAKRIVEQMLMDSCDTAMICDAINIKFRLAAKSQHITTYRQYFFDVDNLNQYEVIRYFERNNLYVPESVPVGGHFKSAYTAYKQGAIKSIKPEEMLNQLMMDAFFRAQEMKNYGWQGDDKLIKFARLAMDTHRTMIDTNKASNELPEEFNFEIEYPETVSVSVHDLSDYDPKENPNADEAPFFAERQAKINEELDQIKKDNE